jgi:hypothetical protein
MSQTCTDSDMTSRHSARGLKSAPHAARFQAHWGREAISGHHACGKPALESAASTRAASCGFFHG